MFQHSPNVTPELPLGFLERLGEQDGVVQGDLQRARLLCCDAGDGSVTQRSYL